jgi:intergrase/recombinase
MDTIVTFLLGVSIGALILTILWSRRCDKFIKDYNNEVRRYYEMKGQLEKQIKSLTERLNEFETIQELKGLA